MDQEQTQFIKLVGLASFLEQQQSLDQCLSGLLSQASAILKCRTCSLMLFKEEGPPGDFTLRLFAKHGYLPPVASCEAVKVKEGIAGYVAASGEPLLVADITHSPFLAQARRPDDPERGFVSIPVVIGGKVVGVLNVSHPADGRTLGREDLDLASFIAILIGKSIQVIQLQNLLRSRYLQSALAQGGEKAFADSASYAPAKLSRILAKSFYREMAQAGFGSDHIVSAATEILSQLNENLAKHKNRAGRDA